MATRSEHMRWCKQRALECLPDTGDAMASLASDFGKHPETVDLCGFAVLAGSMHLDSEAGMRDFIEGFA